MVRVAIVNFSFAEYTVCLANSLAKFAEVILIQPTEVAKFSKPLLDTKIKVCSFKKPRIRDPRNIFTTLEVFRIIELLSPDVVHVQQTNDYWFELGTLFKDLTPLVTTLHDIYRHPGDRDLAPGVEYIRRIFFYRSQQLIVHSSHLSDLLTEKFHIARNRINVIQHGELGNFYTSISNKAEVAREPYTLLFFGRIWAYKGLDYLIKAMPLIREKLPSTKLIIAGRGESISKFLSSNSDTSCYEIINDFIPVESVAELFQRSTVAVLPYVEASQSGVAAIAYGTGTIVVASDIGGLSEIIHHNEDGILVPPKDSMALADSIVRVLSNQAFQDSLRNSASIRVQEDLNWDNIAASTFSVYKKAITSF